MSALRIGRGDCAEAVLAAAAKAVQEQPVERDPDARGIELRVHEAAEAVHREDVVPRRVEGRHDGGVQQVHAAARDGERPLPTSERLRQSA